MTERTCEERLPEHLADRVGDLKTMLAREDPWEGDEELGPLNEYPLGASIKTAIRVDLSTGGPADYVTAIVDAGSIESIEYHFADWFDHASVSLEGEDFEVMERWLGTEFDLDTIGRRD